MGEGLILGFFIRLSFFGVQDCLPFCVHFLCVLFCFLYFLFLWKLQCCCLVCWRSGMSFGVTVVSVFL